VSAMMTSLTAHCSSLCMAQVEQGQHLHAQLQQCDKRLAEVGVALQSAIAERDTAKREALAASAAAPQKTAKELQVTGTASSLSAVSFSSVVCSCRTC
jgi:peptidoglycan hydrolase CwlO-like protein